MKHIALVSREYDGWAEAGGVKDVVKDQAQAFVRIGWQAQVLLPLYGFLWERVARQGRQIWSGVSSHPTRPGPIQVWCVVQDGVDLLWVSTPGFDGKRALYTYTDEDERDDPQHRRGDGFVDAYSVNLEFQWAVASYWAATSSPAWVLGHDGHAGFLPAIAKTHEALSSAFRNTAFGLLIHNAGPAYRQEMPVSPAHEELLGLSHVEARACVLEHHFDPVVSASRHARLATVSENYADELLTGRNDHWSGPLGRWLRQSGTPLEGITNGISTEGKDPRFPEQAGLPVAFDPLRNDWEGKHLCRRFLREALLLNPAQTYGRLVKWDGPLYVMQGRLTAQKGVDALVELTARALRDNQEAAFLIMAQGERRYEERLIQLARSQVHTGRFLYVDKFDHALAQLVFAAGDFFLMPSEYEPCGLTDLKAQLMGTLPVVHAVGGLVKVTDGHTGFTYHKNHAGGFWGAFQRSFQLWKDHPQEIARLRRQAFVSVLENFQWPRILEERYLPWLTEQARVPILTAPPT